MLRELDEVLDKYSFLSKEKLKGVGGWEVLDGSVSTETSPEELQGSEAKATRARKLSCAQWHYYER